MIVQNENTEWVWWSKESVSLRMSVCIRCCRRIRVCLAGNKVREVGKEADERKREDRSKTSQYEKIINQGFRTIGTKMWHPTTSDTGIINAQFHPGICHSKGTALVVKTTIMAMHKKQIVNVSLKPFQMRGTSIQKEESSTSFPVDPQVIS